MPEIQMPEIPQEEVTVKPRDDLYGWAHLYRGTVYVGEALWCCACETWLDTMNAYVQPFGDIVKNGAMCNDYGDWRCGRCVVEKRPNKTDRQQGPDTTEIPAEYASATINELAPRIRSVVTQWGKKYPFMVVHGIAGSGKTRVTWAFIKRFIQDNRRLKVVDAPTAQRDWISCMHPHQRARMQEVWEKAPALIFDDLSACQISTAWTGVVHMLIDRRRIAALPTLITTAASAERLAEIFNPAINSRLNAYEWIELPPKDWRSKGILPFDENGVHASGG